MRQEQDTPTMIAAMEQTRANSKLYRSSYPEASAEIKRESLTQAIDSQIELLEESHRQGRVDLYDAEAVRQKGLEYMRCCSTTATYPSLLGFAAALGYSRQRIYLFIQNNPESETAKVIDSFRSSWSAILMQQGLSRQSDAAVAIFMLKNGGQNLADRVEISATTAQTPLDASSIDAESIAQKYNTLPED